MRFLLTNDDGIYAKGLSALYDELCQEADCFIVAPEIEQSAVGHAITISRPLMVRRAMKTGNFLGYAVLGTPADCVKIGIRELADGPVDMVISGINRGSNAGINVIYSGTVSAATEAVIMGIPALAVSLDTRKDADYAFAAQFVRKMVRELAGNPGLQNTAINVNIPALPREKIKGVRVVRQGKGNIVEHFEKRSDPRDNVYYWISGESQAEQEEKDTDVSALAAGFITITPIQYDLTRYDMLGMLTTAMDTISY
ncbi:MAG: 5'/3'-nucleotidase SurE [Deltaproteobacteria bacterium HGW-Deltaproteobacteria-12]|jgi:5'-nucleotidase|nr:MAG: 5'/3'-nucleotidase SurE [Deltaproteobacteria bacterium HGW-Deltaproteobacteria-12]